MEGSEGSRHAPLAGMRVVELGSEITVPYVGKLFADAGADVVKVETHAGDSLRPRRGTGRSLEGNEPSAFWGYLNSGKRFVALDFEVVRERERFDRLCRDADVIVDDHDPPAARRLRIAPDDLRVLAPAAVVATFTRFGAEGVWADRPANDFTLQALVGATDARGVAGEEPAACGGGLGDFVAAAFGAPVVLAVTLAAAASGEGVHIDLSQFEAMMLAFQTYRPIYDAFAPGYRPTRQIEIPSVEPASDGLVGYCTITGQQWHDFCSMIDAPEWIDDPSLATFDGRMARREEVWARIRAFTERHSVDELVDLASAFRIPTGPIGTGDVVAGFDHFAERGVFVEHPDGFVQPRPPYQFSVSSLVPPTPAVPLGDDHGFDERPTSVPGLDGSVERPLEGVKVLDLSAFWAGPVATNLLRVLGADLVKVESHVRLDGMRWASGLPIPPQDRLWEWSPVYHGANVGKRVVNLDLTTSAGMDVLERLVKESDVVVENFSPRVTEEWGLTWGRIAEIDPATIYVRMPAFGLDGPWRDRVGFAMTMEQVSGLANRTGFADGPPLVPKGPVDSIAGMHAVVAVVLALADRRRTGRGQMIELPLIEGALQAAAQQVVEYSAYSDVLGRHGNRSSHARPQGLYETAADDVWLALSIETDAHWNGLCKVLGVDPAVVRRDDADTVIARWAGEHDPDSATSRLVRAGVPAAVCVHVNDSGRSPQHESREFFQWRDHPVTGPTPYPSYPFLLDGRRLDLGGPAPTLGQHTVEILHELGFDEAAIDALADADVIGDWPAGIPDPRSSA